MDAAEGVVGQGGAQIAVGHKLGPFHRKLGELIRQNALMVWHKCGWNSLAPGERSPVTVDCRAEHRGHRPQARLIYVDELLAGRLRADPERPRTRRQLDGRLRLDLTHATVAPSAHSPDAADKTALTTRSTGGPLRSPRGGLARVPLNFKAQSRAMGTGVRARPAP